MQRLILRSFQRTPPPTRLWWTCAPSSTGTEDWGLSPLAAEDFQAEWQSSRMAELRKLWARAADSIFCGYCKKRTDCLQ